MSSTSYIAASGSTEGGTIVYVKGSGFSLNINSNLVMIGTYPCIVELVSQTTLIKCRTTKPTNPMIQTNLPTKVTVGNSSTLCITVPGCSFSYLLEKTTFI